MDVSRLKEYILENHCIPTILENLGCHSIKNKGSYYQCANPDGDNKTAITVYSNRNLTTVNYTRDISKGKSASNDIFSLVEFFKDINFFESVNLVCNWIGINYYYDFDADLPESLKLTKLILEMQQGDSIISDDNTILKPISEAILNYYCNCVNQLFADDGIDYITQRLFEVGYDELTNRITIPIRDELGNLVGVKGRLLSKTVSENELKYVYLEPCARAKILYGLPLTIHSIRRNRLCYVVEAEKGVQQLWSYGYLNSVATCGKKLSNTQIEKLTRLCVDLVFLFDKDVTKEELNEIANRFIDGVNIYAAVDKQGILHDKESPTDNPDKLKILLKGLIKIK